MPSLSRKNVFAQRQRDVQQILIAVSWHQLSAGPPFVCPAILAVIALSIAMLKTEPGTTIATGNN